MGYSHYYYLDKEINPENFKKIVADFKQVLPVLKHLGVRLGNGHGVNDPILTDKEICFNGLDKCGHTKRDLGLVWPSENAHGVAPDFERKRESDNIDGKWYAGLTLNSRTCDGSCSYETFTLDQTLQNPIHESAYEEEKDPKRKYFGCVKTAFRPYDLAVNVCLIIAKEHLKDQIVVKSDGDLSEWQDAIQVCDHFLHYGKDFNPNNEEDQNLVSEYMKNKYPVKEVLTNEQTKPSDNKIKVNDVFYTSWGYDQTNYDYIKVVSINKSGKSVKCVSIGAKRISSAGFMAEHIKPDPDCITSKSFNMKCENKNYKRCKYNDPEVENLRGTYIKHDQPFRLDTFWRHNGSEDLETSYH